MTKRKTGPHKKRGRPTRYKPTHAEVVRKACEAGFVNDEIAAFLGISHSVLQRWRLQNPELQAALKTGKEAADERVVASLYNRAIGYTYDSVKIFMHEGEPVEVPYREHVPPDVTACIFWLKNRRPDLWRDRHDMTVAKAPTDNRTIMEQWYDLLRDMQAAGAIEITPEDPEYKVLGLAHKPNGE